LIYLCIRTISNISISLFHTLYLLFFITVKLKEYCIAEIEGLYR